MLNKSILMGRLTRDPELKYTNSNLPVIRFSIAVDRNRTGQNGERQTDFIDIVAWRKTAEFVSQWFTKGQMIVVVGSFQSRRWQDKNGNNRTSIEVVADEVQFGDSKKTREGGTQQRQNNYQPYADPAPAQSYNVPAANDFSEISDDDGEVPF